MPPGWRPDPSGLDLDDWFFEFGFGPQAEPAFFTILAGFEHFADVAPQTRAVECGSDWISYGDLNAAAERLAFQLAELGVRHGDAVGLFLRRSIPMVVGIFACLKLGAYYVPQHIGVASEDSLRHISAVTRAKVILSIADCADQIPLGAPQQILLIEDTL